jgi:ketosteroid isomerase-like protein
MHQNLRRSLLVSPHIRVRATGTQQRSDWVHVYTLRNGQIACFQEFYDTAAENKAYGIG